MSDLSSLKQRINHANSIIVALPVDAVQDSVAAALALYLSLQSAGKQASIVSSTQPVVRDSHLVGLDKIETGVGGQNLVVTINLPEDAVDKVTSNVEGGHLNLILQPKPGAAPITKQDLSFGTSGAAADLIVVVGASTLSDLGPIADKEHELFVAEKIANLSNKPATFGSVNLTDTTSSNSELVTAVLQELALPLTPDIASNLMRGIETATSGLSSPTMTADTFEALAVLYRAGARRQATVADGPVARIVNDTPIMDVESKDAPKQEITRSAREDSHEKPAQPDWLKPKIFKGGNPSTR